MKARPIVRVLVPVVVLATLAGCGGNSASSSSPASATPTPSLSSSPTAVANPILNIQMAHGVAADGSAMSPTTVFDSLTDQQVVAVLTLANLGAGTKVSYTRYLDGKFVNSKTAVLSKRSKYFYFIFTPTAGGKFTPGSYRMRFYVNDKRAGETTFQIK